MRPGILVTFVAIIISAIGCNPDMQSPDLIIHNGNIWTANPEQPMAKAMAIIDDRITLIGENEEVLKTKGPQTDIIDLGSAFVTPGFIDSHVHFIQGGFALSSVKLRDASTPEEFISRIGDYAKSIPNGEWIIMGNWNHELWGGKLPSREWIDSVTANNPVFINRLDGHMSLANSLAMELAGISENVEEIEGGEIVRNDQGKLTGIFKDNAMDLVYAKMPNPTQDQLERAIHSAMKFVASKGVTSVHHMGTFSDQEAFERMASRNKLITRIYSSIPLPYWKQLKNKIDTAGQGSEWHRIGGLKGFMDGSLGSHTAVFFDPYDDKPEDKGMFINDVDEMEEWILSSDSAGLHVNIHAIGDRANHKLLNYYEKAQEVNGKKDRRFRIEHAQHLSAEDVPRFKELGVIASMQPYHAIDDGVWAEKLIGDRISRTYVFKDLVDSGAILAFGSDWFVAPPIPLEGIYAAVTRRTLDDKNPEGWVPEQKISVEESLKAYTINGAYASFEEDIKGSLEQGKLADFVVMEKDLFSIQAAEIRDVKILQTFVGGKKIYDSF